MGSYSDRWDEVPGFAKIFLACIVAFQGLAVAVWVRYLRKELENEKKQKLQ